MRKFTSTALAMLIALFAFSAQSQRAEAHSRHGDGALAFGIAAAVIGGIALSGSHHRHRYYNSYYDDGYDGYYDTPRYSYGRSYNRGYGGNGSSFAIGGYGHGHHHRHH